MTYRPLPVRPSPSGGKNPAARRGRAPYLLLTIVAALLAAAPAVAVPSPTILAKQAEARQVLVEIDQLNASLDRSNELVNLANYKLGQVQHDIAINRHELVVAKHNLVESRRAIAKRLVHLYTSGTTSTLDVILGAQNLDELLVRIDAENRVSSVDQQVASQVLLFKSAVDRASRELAVENGQVRQLVAQRTREKQAIEVRLGERRSLLSSLNGEVQRLIAEQQAQELAAQRAAQARAAAAQTQQVQQQVQTFTATPVGVTAQTPEGAQVIPPSSHGGVVGAALSELGVPYVWAGSSPSGFDCSGLVMYAYSKVGVSLPHSSYAMWNEGVAVPSDQLQPGDLVFFNGLGHVGIYIGGGEYVHAPHTGTVVQVSSLASDSSYVGARRIQ